MKFNDPNLAVAECTIGLGQAVRYQADAMKHIDSAITADTNYCRPHLAKAWMLHGANDARYAEQVASLIDTSQRLLPVGASKESGLLAALKPMSAGHRAEGAAKLDALSKEYPTDAFIHLLAQEEAFWLGDAAWMRTIAERAAPHWNESDKDYGPYLSMRAFANEEAGYFDMAERYGREAVEIDSSDVWGAHAVAHVLLMKGEITRGVSWLEALSGNWGGANQMQHHLWWHFCLFLLELGEHDRILHLLHTKIRNPDSALIKASPAATIDIANYASLLMRLELYGVDVRAQWPTLAAICSERTHNHASVFSNIHDMMVLTACENNAGATELLTSMQGQFSDPAVQGSLANAYREVGIPVCRSILAYRAGDYRQVLEVLGDIRHRLHLMGASHAQRDVFFHLLVHAAQQQGRSDLQREYMHDIERLGFCDVPNRAAYRAPQ